MVTREQIEEMTEALRAGRDPMLARIKELLAAKGVEVDRAVLADMFPDDTCFEFGLLVTSDGDVLQFGYDYNSRAESDGSFSEWNNITDTWGSSPYDSQISLALSFLNRAP